MRMDEGTMLRRKLVRNVQLSLNKSYANCDYIEYFLPNDEVL